MKKIENRHLEELLKTIQKASSEKKLLKEFLIDLLSPREYQEIIKRWQIVKRLAQGIPQRKIAEDLRVSIATITRGSRELLNEKGGFREILRRYRQK